MNRDDVAQALHIALHEGTRCTFSGSRLCPYYARAVSMTPHLLKELDDRRKAEVTPVTVPFPSKPTDEPESFTTEELRRHLASEHARWAPGVNHRDLLKLHDHEHDGPGTLRNHPRSSRDWHRNRVRATEDEAFEYEEEAHT